MYQNYYQQNGFFNRFFGFLFNKNVISRLILINSSVFLLVLLNNLSDFLFNVKSLYPSSFSAVLYYLALPADIHQIAQRPWTPFTTMFLHGEFWHFLLNMVMFFFAGKVFLQMLNERKLLISYIIGGLCGSLFFVLSYNFFPVFENIAHNSYAIGASAAIMAVLFTIAAYYPNYEINLFLIGRIKLKYIAIIFVLIDVFSISASNPGGHIAHIGGSVFGLVYGYLLRVNFKLNFGFFAFLKKKFKRKPRMKAYKNNNYKPNIDEDYLNKKAENNKKTDEILDKISKGGYASLTKGEKDFLFNKGDK